MAKLEQFAETTELNKVEIQESTIGVITSGITYQYVLEILPEVDVLRLGITHPLPRKLLREFCANHETVYVIEEGEPFIEEFVRSLGVANLIGVRGHR
jgi:indolepyruvate ferredoxin oxidoreductase alpha subunit